MVAKKGGVPPQFAANIAKKKPAKKASPALTVKGSAMGKTSGKGKPNTTGSKVN